MAADLGWFASLARKLVAMAPRVRMVVAPIEPRTGGGDEGRKARYGQAFKPIYTALEIPVPIKGLRARLGRSVTPPRSAGGPWARGCSHRLQRRWQCGGTERAVGLGAQPVALALDRQLISCSPLRSSGTCAHSSSPCPLASSRSCSADPAAPCAAPAPGSCRTRGRGWCRRSCGRTVEAIFRTMKSQLDTRPIHSYLHFNATSRALRVAAEELEVHVLRPALDHRLVALAIGVLQVQQRHHPPGSAGGAGPDC